MTVRSTVISSDGHAGADLLWGNEGNDVLDGDHGPDLLLVGPDDDLLMGNTGNDRAWGGAGLDDLNGGAGDDELISIENDGLVDLIDCGEGRDRVIVQANDSVDPAGGCERVILITR